MHPGAERQRGGRFAKEAALVGLLQIPRRTPGTHEFHPEHSSRKVSANSTILRGAALRRVEKAQWHQGDQHSGEWFPQLSYFQVMIM